MTQGTSELNAFYKNTKKILIVTNIQVCILLSFNNVVSEKLKLKQICEVTNV